MYVLVQHVLYTWINGLTNYPKKDNSSTDIFLSSGKYFLIIWWTGTDSATKLKAREQYKGSFRRELQTTMIAIPITIKGGRG